VWGWAMWKRMAAIMMALALALALPVYAGELTTQVGSGTGFVVSPDGYILTNEHVIHGAESVSVTVNGTNYIASVVKANEAKDLALLKVDGRNLPVLAIATSSHVSVGDTVYALGCPRGICGTLSTGTVANLGIVFTNLDVALIMLDLTLTHGNSGGPLLNAQGEVIGVTRSGLLSSSGENASETGYSFAIPIDEANALLALVPGVQRPGANQIGSALAAQEVRDKVGGAVAYVESRSEIPLASLLPQEVAPYGALSTPDVWTQPPPPPPPDPRLVRLVALFAPQDDLLLVPRPLSNEERAEIETLIRDLLETGTMTPFALCSSLPGHPTTSQCSALFSFILGRPVPVEDPLKGLLDLLNPPIRISPSAPFFSSTWEHPAGSNLRSPLDRLSANPLAYAHSTVSKTYKADFLIAAFENNTLAASEAAKIPSIDLEGMTEIETGTLGLGGITAAYKVGYDTAKSSWISAVDGNSSPFQYVVQDLSTPYISAEACLRATAAFAIADVLFAVSVSWTEGHTAENYSSVVMKPDGTISSSPSPVGQYGYADGCIRYTKDTSSQTRTCRQTVLDELQMLLAAQFEALSAALGE